MGCVHIYSRFFKIFTIKYSAQRRVYELTFNTVSIYLEAFKGGERNRGRLYVRPGLGRDI